ncbi:hypothetical protein DES49_1597 [Halospina denitrificans]|uniref:Uncharacterized protein n=1 Tax=Halospina denitrificans TaxID=332522 RepID=A0A4R7JT65_9GAMM|nr:hypothetical protein [Halospina denitrificans]TDT41502.1 hypothetical protein DES49_1597 [Halospina denitrificans]
MPKQSDIPSKFNHGWLQDLDSRTALARELRERYKALTDDLGGADRLSYAQASLAERALWLERFLVLQEQELANGREFDASRWVQACNSLQGILTKLRLERKAKEVPSLGEYLKAKGGNQ